MYSEFISDLLKKASKIASENYGKVEFTFKEDADRNQVLTETDLIIGRFLVNNVKKIYPSHNIIDEEIGIVDNKSEYTWVIDPIDGTSNFANGFPNFGIMIGLLKGESPIAGGISLPYFSELLYAEKGLGAYCDDKRLMIRKERNLSQSLIAYGIDGHPEKPEKTRGEALLLGEIILSALNLRMINSCAFDMSALCQGKYGAVINQTNRIWDCVAPQIIVEQAGGIYTNVFGEPLNYSVPLKRVEDNFTFCAASSVLHKQLQKIIHSIK